MKEYKFNLKQHAPEVQKQWNDLFLGRILGGRRLEPDTFKMVSSMFFNIISHKDLMKDMTKLSIAYHNAYKEYLGQANANDDKEEDDSPAPSWIKDQNEEEVKHNQWRRFVAYTTESAKHNGRLKQTDNAKAYMWLRNNELLGFNCGTDLRKLPKKYKELIVYAAKHKFEGISMKLNPQTCKYNISLDYLDYVCACIEPLF